jgi:poly(A) polymerase
VKRGIHQFEVATFRRESTPEDLTSLEEGEEIPSGDNFFGTPEQDAIRRDFTINALFYDPIKSELIDFANGMADIEARIVRMIGDPRARIVEDSIRALRAIRLSHKLKFKIESSFREAIALEAEIVGKSAMPRRREEYLKMFRLPEPELALLEMLDLGLLKVLMPSLYQLFENPESRDRFLLYMRRWKEMVKDLQQPVEIYTALAWAFSSSLGEMKDMEEKLDQFLRVDLGVFKGESMGIQRVFQMQKRLLETEQFQKRGARRQQSFLSLPELPVAVRLAQVECLLSPSQCSYWNSLLAGNQSL